MDKVLVYRYFGGLDGLLSAYAASADFWPSLEERVGDAGELRRAPLAERVFIVLKRYAAALRSRPRTLAILAGELRSRSAFHWPLEQARGRLGMALLKLADDSPRGVDLAAVTAVLSAGLQHLLLRGQTVREYNGLPLSTDEGWKRIERATRAMLTGVLG